MKESLKLSNCTDLKRISGLEALKVCQGPVKLIDRSVVKGELQHNF